MEIGIVDFHGNLDCESQCGSVTIESGQVWDAWGNEPYNGLTYDYCVVKGVRKRSVRVTAFVVDDVTIEVLGTSEGR